MYLSISGHHLHHWRAPRSLPSAQRHRGTHSEEGRGLDALHLRLSTDWGPLL